MVKFWWVLLLLEMVLASDNDLQDPSPDKESRFLLPLFSKRFDSHPAASLPVLTSTPLAGPRCSSRLETALDQIKRRKRNQPKNLDTPMSQTIDLDGYSMYQHLRTAPVDMYVTRMRVRLPQNSNWVRVERCFFDPRNVSLDTMLLFNDLTISGNVDLYDNNLDRTVRSRRKSRDFITDTQDLYRENPYKRSRGLNGCNMILRLRKAGIGFHTRPLNQQPGKFNVKTDSEFVEPGFISVYAYGCERYINRNSGRNREHLPLSRKRRSDEFTFDSRIFDEVEGASARTGDWDTYETDVGNRMNYERSKLFRPDDQLDEAEDISREMEDIFTKGIRTLLTTYMKKELQPAIKETLMRNMGYVISYG